MMPKRFKGAKTFKNYKELCAFLEIEPAPRGTAKEEQLKELRKTYDIIKFDSGRYTVTYLTQKELEYRAGITGGWIQTIDGYEVNLKSSQRYQHTGIDDYILYCALNSSTETMRDFQILCFHSCSYFYKLLNRDYNGNDGLDSLQEQYDAFILTKVDELIEGRLDDKVDYLLKEFEKKKYISVERYYRLNNKSTVSLEIIQPYVDEALKVLNYKNEYFACRSKLSREIYFQKRNELFQEGEETDLEIVRKELHITPLLTPTDDRYPKLSQEQQAKVLNNFFNVFRARLLFDLQTTYKISRAQVPTRLKAGIHDKDIEQLLSEIIEKYCSYEATSNDISFNSKQFDYYAVSGLEDTLNSLNSGAGNKKSEITE